MPDTQPAVIIKELFKSFKLPHERHSGVKQVVLSVFNRKRSYETQHVLTDVSFEIKQGEFFGIVGRNGSGKSTLLKLLAGIYVPDKGLVQVRGSLVPFIELGVGFNPELTGRENVFLNGALLGFGKSQMERMYDEIVEFAELGGFMDQKLKNYSSGMQVRLAFSIAIRARSDILLIDEVLAVGDAAFQQKCFDYFDKMKAEKRTIIFVSHDMEAVKKYCSRAVLIDKGQLVHIGDPQEIAQAYQAANDASIDAYTAESNDEQQQTDLKIELLDSLGKAQTRFAYGQTMTVCLSWPAEKQVKNAGVGLYTATGVCVYATNTFVDKVSVEGRSIDYRVELTLGSGRYRVIAGTFLDTKEKIVDFVAHGPEFSIDGQKNNEEEGLVRLPHTWEKAA